MTAPDSGGREREMNKSAPDWEIGRLNKQIALEHAAHNQQLAELLEVFKCNKPAEAVRLARKLIEVEMK